MPTPRKYFGPCEVHANYIKRCKHCEGWDAHVRRFGGERNPRRRYQSRALKWVRRKPVIKKVARWNGTLHIVTCAATQ